MINKDFDIRLLENIEDIETPQEFSYSIEVEKAEGFYFYDKTMKKYLDLTSNQENNPFAYFPENTSCYNTFIDSNSLISNDAVNLQNAIKETTGLSNSLFFSNQYDPFKFVSKTLNKHLGLNNKDKILISCTQSSKNLIDVKDTQKDYIPLNNESIVKTVFTRTTGAVIIQLAQISSEITVAEEEYLKLLRELCTKNNALLVFDATSLSPLRLNNGLFNYNNEIQPDMLIVSKGLTQGIPFSIAAYSEKVPEVSHDDLNIGAYNPAYIQALNLIQNKNDYLSSIKEKVEIFVDKMEKLAETHISLVDFLPQGMLFSIVLDISAYDAAKEAFQLGVIPEVLNEHTLLLCPPYNIGEEQIDEFISVMDLLFDKLAKFDRLK